jgi:hypothetical protein
MKPLTESAQVMLLILAAHEGPMAKADAEAEFIRVAHLNKREFDDWVKQAKAQSLRNFLKEIPPHHQQQ